MNKRKLGFALLGLLAILSLPFSTCLAAGQEQATPPEHPMPVPGPAFFPIDGTSTSDTSPAFEIMLPEVIWAPASGGGTWMSRLQVGALESGTIVQANFFYGTTQTGYYTIWTSTGVNQSATFANILNTLGTLKGVSLYGLVGSMSLTTQSTGNHIIADVETMNGNYGKSLPGIQWTDNTCINYGKPGMIEDISNTAAWRTGVGCFNNSSQTITVRFYVLTSAWSYVGNTFDYTLVPWQFVSFNPFTQAGLGSSSLDGYRLYIEVQSTTGTSPYPLGLQVYGSKANNTTNDSCALLCKMYHL